MRVSTSRQTGPVGVSGAIGIHNNDNYYNGCEIVIVSYNCGKC